MPYYNPPVIPKSDYYFDGTNVQGANPLAYSALTTGHDNIALGINALNAVTSGSNNIAIGTNALSNITLGSNNTTIGNSSLLNNFAQGNIIIGNSLTDSGIGLDCVAIGNGIELNGNECFALGKNSLANGGGTAIGTSASADAGGFALGAFSVALSGSTAIGDTSFADTNSIAIGNGAVAIPNECELGAQYITLTHLYGGVLLQQFSTANRPTYRRGLLYYDSTLQKLRIGGATGYETITSV